MVDFKEILNQDVQNPESVTMLGDEFVIMDNPKLLPSGRYPYKNEWLIATLCESGSASGEINLREYRIASGGFIIILPGQIIVRSELSEDFRGRIILMSSSFAESIDIGRTLTITTSIENRPYYQFNQDAIEIMRSYVASGQAIIRQAGDSQTVREALRLISRAFFLSSRSMLTSGTGTSPIGPYSRLTEKFLSMVENEYRSHRQLAYYAEQLGRSPKYLSRLIKQETGQNATDWIDRCVLLDAKAQLLSSNKTILEVSDSLGFPSQSFFGKYFKRVTGLSPREFIRQAGQV